jgi:predicted dehydrogenase
MSKIKLAIVGTGGMAGTHAGQIKEVADAEVVGLVDINPKNLEKHHREKWNGDAGIRLYDSIEELFKDPPEGLRGVLLVTPHTVHFPQAMLALEKGYDVLVEKPMVTRSDHAAELQKQIKRTGRHLQVAFQAPFTHEFAYIRQVLTSGDLGELQTITAVSHQYWRNAVAGTWRQDPAQSGGGQMYDTGAHLFNAIAWLIDRPAEEVYCVTDNKGTAVDINAVMTIRFQGNVLASVTISGNSPGWHNGIWIAGEKGRLFTQIHGGELQHHDTMGKLIKYPAVTQASYTPVGNFVACLQGKAEPRCGVRYGILHSWLMDALYRSAAEGRPVKVPKYPL